MVGTLKAVIRAFWVSFLNPSNPEQLSCESSRRTMRYNFPEDQHSHQGKLVKQTIFHLHIRSSVVGLRTSPRWYLIGKIPLFLTWLVIIQGGNFSARLPVIHKTDEGHISGYKKDNLSTIEAFWNIISKILNFLFGRKRKRRNWK